MTAKDPRRGLAHSSMLARLASCSGSLALENALKASGRYIEIQNPYAPVGTRGHRYLELECQGKYTEAEQVLQSREELSVAQKCIELRQAIMAEWIARTYGDAEQPIIDLVLEKRYWYRAGLFPRFSGQLDFIAIDRTNKRAIIFDYKFGRKESEEASDNLQLRSYVVLLKHNEPELEEIQAAIIEPLVSWDSVRVQYTGDALRQAEQEIVAIVDEAQWHPERRVAGTWCVHCPARANCREAIDYSQNLPNPTTMRDIVMELPRGDRGVQLWERIKVAKKLLETLEKTYTKILEAEPGALPGYVLPAEGRERRFVPHPDKLKAALAEYLTSEEIDGCASFHLEKLQEVLGLKHHLAGKELEKLFAKLTRDAVAIGHDAPFIRPLTKKEREQTINLIDARAAFREPAQLTLESGTKE